MFSKYSFYVGSSYHLHNRQKYAALVDQMQTLKNEIPSESLKFAFLRMKPESALGIPVEDGKRYFFLSSIDSMLDDLLSRVASQGIQFPGRNRSPLHKMFCVVGWPVWTKNTMWAYRVLSVSLSCKSSCITVRLLKDPLLKSMPRTQLKSYVLGPGVKAELIDSFFLPNRMLPSSLIKWMGESGASKLWGVFSRIGVLPLRVKHEKFNALALLEMDTRVACTWTQPPV